MKAKFVSFHDVAKEFCGGADFGVTDLATNPKTLEAPGRDSMGGRLPL